MERDGIAGDPKAGEGAVKNGNGDGKYPKASRQGCGAKQEL
jgi:hypothetical protein